MMKNTARVTATPRPGLPWGENTQMAHEEAICARIRELSAISLATVPWAARQPARLSWVAWVGDVDTARDDGFLIRNGISGIVNCAGPSCRGMSQEWLTRHYLELDARDAEDYDILQHVPEVAAFCQNLLSRAAHTGTALPTVLIHCHAGVNRSVALAVAVTHLLTGIAVIDLVHAVAAVRPVLTNPSFQRQLAVLAARAS